MRVLLLVFILAVTGSVFAQTDGTSAEQSNREALELYKKRDLKKAALAAAAALESAKKAFGSADRRTAVIATNLGLILAENKRHSESAIAFGEALAIYERLPGLKANELVDASKNLGDAQYSDDNDAGEGTFIRALESLKTKFPTDAESGIRANINLGRYYALKKRYGPASERFLTAYETAFNSFGGSSKQIETVENAFACHARSKQPPKDSYKFYEDGVKKITGTDAEPSEIVNGKAKVLPKPRYPVAAREKGLGGRVVVRVKINEKGDVIAATAICGIPEFFAAVEEVSGDAKFGVTLKNGKPVKVDGFIFYNFLP